MSEILCHVTRPTEKTPWTVIGMTYSTVARKNILNKFKIVLALQVSDKCYNGPFLFGKRVGIGNYFLLHK